MVSTADLLCSGSEDLKQVLGEYHLPIQLSGESPRIFVTGCYFALSEKAMAPHSSTLAWEIQWREEPRGLQSMGSLRVRHN